jgi:putative methionine-R-sulfoxide reductase with GAF domain
MPARLTIHFPAAPARELILPEGETLIGRGADCGLALEDDRVSRRHASLSWGPAGWTVADLGSKNGTQVDGRAVLSAPLAEQHWLSFGGLLVRFELLLTPVATLHQERLRRLTSALGIQRDLKPGVGLRELLAQVVTSMLSLTNAERGFLLLAQAGGELEVAARSGISWDDLRAAEFGGSIGAVERALTAGRAVVTADIRTDVELGGRASVVNGGIRALLCVPVAALDRRIGVMYADSRQPGAVFTELDLEILEALAAQAGLAISVARLDGELRGLASRLAVETDKEDGAALRILLAGQITDILDRSLSAAPPAAGAAGDPAGGATQAFRDTWRGLLAVPAPVETSA